MFVTQYPPPSPTRRSSDLRHCPRPIATVSLSGLHHANQVLLQCRAAGRVAKGAVRAAGEDLPRGHPDPGQARREDRKSTRLNSSHANISYAVFCLKKKIML